MGLKIHTQSQILGGDLLPKSEGREGEETEENNETHQIADPGGE